MNENIKKELIRISIVFAFLLIITGFVILSMFLQKNRSEKHTTQMIENYLLISKAEPYRFDSRLNLKSGLSESLGFYRLKSEDNTAVAILARITGFSGPQSCLFLFNEDTFELSFISIVGLQNDLGYSIVENYFDYGINDSILSYWMETMLSIIQKGDLI